MSQDAEEDASPQAPASKRKWSVWGVWFGVGLLLWAVDITLGVVASSNHLAFGVWGLVYAAALTPFVGYFVQEKIKTFDLYGVFAMTLAVGLAFEIVPMSIAKVCTLTTPSTVSSCTYVFGLDLNGNLPNLVGGLRSAANVSIVIMAGALFYHMRRSGFGVSMPSGRRTLLLAACLAIGFLFPVLNAATLWSSGLIFASSYPMPGWSRWYEELMLLLLGPVLAVSLGYILHRWLGAAGIKEIVPTVALGSVLAFLAIQAYRGTMTSIGALNVLGAVGSGIFSAWIVLGGHLLSILEKEGADGQGQSPTGRGLGPLASHTLTFNASPSYCAGNAARGPCQGP